MSHDQEDHPDFAGEDERQPEPQEADDGQKQSAAQLVAKDKQYQLKPMDLTSIFVNNLEENTTEEELREYFKDCGTIEKITIRNDKMTGLLYSYLQFTEQAAVEDAILLSDGMIRGRKIKVFQKRTNLRTFGRRSTRGRPMRMSYRGRYAYAAPAKGRGQYRGGYNKFGGA